MSQPEDTLQPDADLMEQNIMQVGDLSNKEDQDILTTSPATVNGGTSHSGNVCIPGLYGAINPNQYDTSGQLFFPEAHASNLNVFNSHGTGYVCCPPVNNTAGFTGAGTSIPPDPSIMVAAPNGLGHQISHEPPNFDPYQDGTNGQGAYALDFEQEVLNFQGSFPFNSDQAGPSGHRSPVFDADQSGPNGHNPRAVNSGQGDKSSQGPIVSNPCQADPKGKGSLALNSNQTSPNRQGFLAPNSDQTKLSIQDQIASIFDLSQTHVLDNPTLWKPMTVEDIARNPAATFQYFVNFQNSLQSSHEIALDKVQTDYAIAFEKVRNDYAMALQEAYYNIDAYCCKLRADLEYLRSDNATKTQTIRDFRNFLENLNREMSTRGLRLSPTSIPSRPITQIPAEAGGLMGAQPNAGVQTGTAASKNGNVVEVMNTTGQGHAAHAAAAGGQMGSQPIANGKTGVIVPRNGNVGPGHVAHTPAAADGPMMPAHSNAGNLGGQTRIRIGNGARQSSTPGQLQKAPRPQTPGPTPPQGALRPLLPGKMLVPPGPSLASRHAASPSLTNGRNKRTLSEMSPAAPEKKKLAR